MLFAAVFLLVTRSEAWPYSGLPCDSRCCIQLVTPCTRTEVLHPSDPGLRGVVRHLTVTLAPAVAVKLNANRAISGIMRGYDQFMNIVLDAAHDDKEDVELGMVVRSAGCGLSSAP